MNSSPDRFPDPSPPRSIEQPLEHSSDGFDPTRYIPRPPRSLREIFAASIAAEPATTAKNEAAPTAKDHSEPTIHPRQPHLGYTLLLLLIGTIVLGVCTLLVFAIGGALHLLPTHHLHPEELPKSSILCETLGYTLTLAIIVPLFARMWHCSFAGAIHLSFPVAKRNLGKLLLLGAALSLLAQLAESRLILPKQMPIDAFFRTSADIWVVALFGTFIAPIAEELFFRGFLLPSLAIAFDWLRHPRTEDGRTSWLLTSALSRPALLFAAAFSSILFGLLHAAQLGFAWNAVALLSVVGGILAAVRLRFNSVAASTLVHMAYNGFIFAILFAATGGFRHLENLHNH